MSKPKILVVGSMNMDLFVKGANKVPKLSESVLTKEYGYATGGKGANQAVAAALQGADVNIVAKVGNDDYGKKLMSELEGYGVKTHLVTVADNTQTGLAIMLLNDDGRYIAYISLGANDTISVLDVKKALDAETFDMIVMQLEMPLETVYKTYELAKERNIPVFLDAGPGMSLELERFEGIYVLSPNEAETEALVGIWPDTEEKALEAAKILYSRSKPEYVIIKLGSRGVLIYNGNEHKLIPCFKVDAIDSTAAGDTFGAALTIRLCKGDDMENAIRFAQAAAGICVSKIGAQISIPNEEEVLEFLSSQE